MLGLLEEIGRKGKVRKLERFCPVPLRRLLFGIKILAYKFTFFNPCKLNKESAFWAVL
jgi:hypothetical protein